MEVQFIGRLLDLYIDKIHIVKSFEEMFKKLKSKGS